MCLVKEKKGLSGKRTEKLRKRGNFLTPRKTGHESGMFCRATRASAWSREIGVEVLRKWEKKVLALEGKERGR